ncbi:hypothetical protein [Rhodanobacter umsongensis]
MADLPSPDLFSPDALAAVCGQRAGVVAHRRRRAWVAPRAPCFTACGRWSALAMESLLWGGVLLLAGLPIHLGQRINARPRKMNQPG